MHFISCIVFCFPLADMRALSSAHNEQLYQTIGLFSLIITYVNIVFHFQFVQRWPQLTHRIYDPAGRTRSKATCSCLRCGGRSGAGVACCGCAEPSGWLLCILGEDRKGKLSRSRDGWLQTVCKWVNVPKAEPGSCCSWGWTTLSYTVLSSLHQMNLMPDKRRPKLIKYGHLLKKSFLNELLKSCQILRFLPQSTSLICDSEVQATALFPEWKTM